jgi:hypothetical protein
VKWVYTNKNGSMAHVALDILWMLYIHDIQGISSGYPDRCVSRGSPVAILGERNMHVKGDKRTN